MNLFSKRSPETAISCVGIDDPVAECTLSQSVKVQGYLAQDPIQIADSDAADPSTDDDDWLIVTVKLIDPGVEGRDFVQAGAKGSRATWWHGAEGIGTTRFQR